MGDEDKDGPESGAADDAVRAARLVDGAPTVDGNAGMSAHAMRHEGALATHGAEIRPESSPAIARSRTRSECRSGQSVLQCRRGWIC